MGKKIWYSQPLWYLWEHYRDQQRIAKISIDDFCTLNKQTAYKSEPEYAVNAHFGSYDLFHEDATGRLLHLFFEDENLKGFLESTKLADLDGIKRFLSMNGDNKTLIFMGTDDKADCIQYSFVLHSPYENKKEGYAFLITYNRKDDYIELVYTKGSKVNSLTDFHYKTVLKNDSDIAKEMARMFRLAMNTIAYMYCYPDCIVEGVPRITVDNGEMEIRRAISLKTSEKVKESAEANNKSPHFRKGYWKYCGSDFYTNMQGQFVFVSETMVKGQAKTVKTASDLSSFS